MLSKKLIQYLPKANSIFKCIIIFQIISLFLIVLGNNSLISNRPFQTKTRINLIDVESTKTDTQVIKFSDQEVPVIRKSPGDFQLETNLPDNFSSKLIFKVIKIKEFGMGILMSGDISDGDAKRFRQNLKEWSQNDIKFIALHSPGGIIEEALEIGKEIRSQNLNTLMPAFSICLSACPYIFASGVSRIKGSRSLIGVHQSYYEENLVLPLFFAVESIQKTQAEIFKHLREMGTSTDLIEFVLDTPPEEMYMLSDDELSKFSLVTQFIRET